MSNWTGRQKVRNCDGMAHAKRVRRSSENCVPLSATRSHQPMTVRPYNSPHCQAEIVDSQRLFSSLAVGIPTEEPQLPSFLSKRYPDKLELYDHSGTCYSGCPLFQNIIQFIERRSAVVNIVFHSCFHNISGRHKPYGIRVEAFFTPEHI